MIYYFFEIKIKENSFKLKFKLLVIIFVFLFYVDLGVFFRSWNNYDRYYLLVFIMY